MSNKNKCHQHSEVYCINDLCKMLEMNRTQVFELINKNYFRTIHIKGCTRISKPSFDKWFRFYKSPYYPIKDNKWNPKKIRVSTSTYGYFYPNGEMSFDSDASKYTDEAWTMEQAKNLGVLKSLDY